MINPEIYEDVRALFEHDSSGHDYYHTLRVVSLAKTIAAKEGADMDTVELAALLHDSDDRKLFGGNSNNAEKLMTKHGYSSQMQGTVLDIIDRVSFSKNGTSQPETIESQVVQDADRLDAMGAIGIARTFAYGGSTGRAIHFPEAETDLSTSIGHFYQKLLRLKDLMNTDTAKGLAESRHVFMLSFLDEFYSEWDGKR